MATISQLLNTAPVTTRGSLIGVDDWKIVVEAALPGAGEALWGIGEWGTDEWAELTWLDLTPYVRGLEWTRGADEEWGRPRIGELTMTLDSADDRWSPWNQSPPVGSAAYFAPGTVVRVGVRSATDTRANGWIPQFTGIVDSWQHAETGVRADRYAEVMVVETLSALTQIDENARTTAVGAGDEALERFVRLLEEWPYGVRLEAQNIINAGAFVTLQSTNMSLNRIAECYLTADSTDTVFRSARNGKALIAAPWYNGAYTVTDSDVYPLMDFSFLPFPGGLNRPFLGLDWYEHTESDMLFVPYDPDTFRASNDAASIINDARFSRVGGTQQQYEQVASISRYGRRTVLRNDLIVESDAVVAALAENVTLRRGLTTLRLEEATISISDRGDDVYLACLAADIGCEAIVYPPSETTGVGSNRPRLEGYIANMTHRVTPRSEGGVTWQMTLGVDTYEVRYLPTAQLPPTV